MLNFSKFSQERRLVRCLSGGHLEPACLEALRGLLAVQERREALPWVSTIRTWLRPGFWFLGWPLPRRCAA